MIGFKPFPTKHLKQQIPCEHCLSRVLHTLMHSCTLVFISKYFLISFVVSSSNNGLFTSILFNLQMFGDFPGIFLLLILIILVLENILYDFIVFYTLRLIFMS